MPGYSVFGHFSRGDTINGGEQLQKKECGHFEERSAHQAKTLCINAIFLEYSKEGKLSPSHIGIRNTRQTFVLMAQNVVSVMVSVTVGRKNRR